MLKKQPISFSRRRCFADVRALILYHNENPDWLYRRILRFGFRHCAILIDDGEYWIGLDSADGRPLVKVIADSDFDLAAHYRCYLGYTVQEVDMEQGQALSGGLALQNCVTAIKRLLCIRAWWVQTPYRLYRYLERVHARQLSFPEGPE